jgi:hypothetical protein
MPRRRIKAGGIDERELSISVISQPPPSIFLDQVVYLHDLDVGKVSNAVQEVHRGLVSRSTAQKRPRLPHDMIRDDHRPWLRARQYSGGGVVPVAALLKSKPKAGISELHQDSEWSAWGRS